MKTSKVTTLQHTELFGCLTAEELANIAQRAAELHFKKGEMLFLSGEQAKGLFVVVSGQIRVFQQNAEGREQVMHIVLPVLWLLKLLCSMGGRIPHPQYLKSMWTCSLSISAMFTISVGCTRLWRCKH